MVKEMKAGKIVLAIRKGVFNAEDIYKFINKKIISLGYIFAEEQQKVKSDQYGNNITSVFLGFKDIDEFVKGRIKVTMTFEKINKVKTKTGVMDNGNITILFQGFIYLDFEEKWSTSPFKVWMLNQYIKYFKTPVIKKKYIKVTAKEVTALYQAVKKKLEMY